MEIIVGTFFIIYLIVFLCREGIRALGEDRQAIVLGIFDGFSVLALWLAIDYLLETNNKDILAFIWWFLIIPIGLCAVVWCLYMCCSDYHRPYEQHRKMGLVVLSNKNNLSGNIDSNWLDKEKNPQKWDWLKK